MPDPTNDRHIEELLDNLDGGYWPEKHAALTALVAERDALQAKVNEHAEGRRKYIDAWADWIEANAGLEIDQWLRVYADAVPIPSLDGDEAKERVFKHLDQRMRDASDAIDALRKRVEYMKALNTAAASIICERDALKQRAAELEAQEFTLPHDPFRDADRDLRERLDIIIPWMKKATTMLCDARRLHKDECFDLVNRCDAAIAAMRKGEQNAD